MNVKFKGRVRKIEEGKTVAEAFKKEIENNEYQVLGCLYNNEYRNLETEIEENAQIDLIDMSTKEGMKIYRRTIVYIMGKAFERLYPKGHITVEYQLGSAMFCKCDNVKITEAFIKNLKKEMENIIKEDLEIKKIEMNRKEAKKFYEETGTTKGKLQFDLKENKEIYIYYCEDYYNYCYGVMANRTGVITKFDIVKYENGFLIRYPQSKNPNRLSKFVETKKVAWALEEFNKIHSVLGMSTVYKINKAIEDGKIQDTIMLAEALHEKKIANIADQIVKKKNVKMVLIAGPSSSGKTTFAGKLCMSLKVNGIKPITISVDNYFVERKDNPLDEHGNYDFECIEALDIDLFNRQLVDLLDGKEVELPTFNFTTGTKEYLGNKLKLEKDEILIIEGIHCMNDKLTSLIPRENKFKVYISDLTVLNIDYYNRISTTDTRLIRRIVRDYKFRNYSAEHTLKTWYSVNRGEQKNIFPYQEEADCMFNSSIVYELAVLKEYAIPLLEEIPNTSPQYLSAIRLRTLLKYFEDFDSSLVPNNSLLREFIGGSIFYEGQGKIKQ